MVRAVICLYVITMIGRSGAVHDKKGIEFSGRSRYIVPALLQVRLERRARPLCAAQSCRDPSFHLALRSETLEKYIGRALVSVISARMVTRAV